MKLNLDDYMEGYIIINILNYFIDKKVFSRFFKGIPDKEFVGIEKTFLSCLEHVGILYNKKSYFYFTQNFINYLNEQGYSKLLLFLGYKSIFDRLHNYLHNYKEINLDYNKIALGSYLSSRKRYIDFFPNFIKSNNIKTILDIGGGNGFFVLDLLKYVQDIKVIVVEKNRDLCKKLNITLKSRGYNNILVINKSIEELVKINFFEGYKIDLVTGFFVFHELLNVEEIISLIGSKFFVIKEFAPFYDDIYFYYRKFNHKFYLFYFLIHELTNQKTKSIKEWISIFKKNGYTIDLEHSKINDLDSLYPFLVFKKNEKLG